MMSPHRVAGRFFSRPLLLAPGAAENISAFLLSRLSNPAAAGGLASIEHDAGESRKTFPSTVRRDGTAEVHSPRASRFYGEFPMSEDGSGRPLPFRRTDKGVANITLVGEWVNRGGWIGASSGLISYEGFKVQMLAASADPRTKAILLDLESPGGEAVGAFEAAEVVRQVAARKPVIAVVNGMAASAAYAIASAANRIVSIPTGISGSIGVVLMHLDISEYLKAEGMKPTFIHAGAHKIDGNPYQPLPPSVRTDLQAEVEAFFRLFVATVAKGRPRLSDNAIRATEARCFMGREAVAAGLVDAIGTFEEVLADLPRAGSTRPPATSARASASATETNPMHTRQPIPAPTAASPEAPRPAASAQSYERWAPVGAAEANVEGVNWDALADDLNARNGLRRGANSQWERVAGAQSGAPINAADIYANRRAACDSPHASTAPQQAGAVDWDTITAETNAKYGLKPGANLGADVYRRRAEQVSKGKI
ncbi:S49 family peptidase [Methylobacterium aquaticum]|uniref:S49 family peptidase n=1 Tax=Methylobacterium aquaticum TaxID=270351 RepID=UPI003D16A418